MCCEQALTVIGSGWWLFGVDVMKAGRERYAPTRRGDSQTD